NAGLHSPGLMLEDKQRIASQANLGVPDRTCACVEAGAAKSMAAPMAMRWPCTLTLIFTSSNILPSHKLRRLGNIMVNKIRPGSLVQPSAVNLKNKTSKELIFLLTSRAFDNYQLINCVSQKKCA